jgi:hypothetical protein
MDPAPPAVHAGGAVRHLYTTPVVYLHLDRLHAWLRGTRASAPSRAQALLMKAG